MTIGSACSFLSDADVACGFGCKMVGLVGDTDDPAAVCDSSNFDIGRVGCSAHGVPSSPFSKVKIEA